MFKIHCNRNIVAIICDKKYVVIDPLHVGALFGRNSFDLQNLLKLKNDSFAPYLNSFLSSSLQQSTVYIITFTITM